MHYLLGAKILLKVNSLEIRKYILPWMVVLSVWSDFVAFIF